MLEVDFKPNLTLQIQLVRSVLHSLIYCELTLSLFEVGLPTYSLIFKVG